MILRLNNYLYKIAGLYYLDLDTLNYYRIAGHPYNVNYNRELDTFLIDLYFSLKVPTQFFFELFFFSPTYKFSFKKFYFNDIFMIGNGFNNFRKFRESYFHMGFNQKEDYFFSRYHELFSGDLYNLSDVCLSKRSTSCLFDRVVKPNFFSGDVFISLFHKFLKEDLLFKNDDMIIVYDKIRTFPFFNRARDNISFYLPTLYDKYRFWQKVNSHYILDFSKRIFDVILTPLVNNFIYDNLISGLDKFFYSHLILLSFWNLCKLFFFCDFKSLIFRSFKKLKYFVLILCYFNFQFMWKAKELKFLLFLFFPHFFNVGNLLTHKNSKTGLSSYLFLLNKHVCKVPEYKYGAFHSHKLFKYPSTIWANTNSLFWSSTHIMYNTNFKNYADVHYTNKSLPFYMKFFHNFIRFIKFFFLRNLTFKTLSGFVHELNVFQISLFFRLLILYFVSSTRFAFLKSLHLKFRRSFYRKLHFKVKRRFKNKKGFWSLVYNFFSWINDYKYYSKCCLTIHV